MSFEVVLFSLISGRYGRNCQTAPPPRPPPPPRRPPHPPPPPPTPPPAPPAPPPPNPQVGNFGAIEGGVRIVWRGSRGRDSGQIANPVSGIRVSQHRCQRLVPYKYYQPLPHVQRAGGGQSLPFPFTNIPLPQHPFLFSLRPPNPTSTFPVPSLSFIPSSPVPPLLAIHRCASSLHISTLVGGGGKVCAYSQDSEVRSGVPGHVESALKIGSRRQPR